MDEVIEEDDDGVCRICGAEYYPYGDGWDGMCPDCADRAFIAENEENEA